MEFLFIAIMMMIISANVNAMPEDAPVSTLDDVIVHPVLPPLNIQKRETSASIDGDFNKFIEEKLVQHTRALEHLVNVVQSNEDLTKRLIDNLGQYVTSPKMPEKIEVQRVANSDHGVDENDHPIVKAGKKLPLYGNLVKDMILDQVHRDPDPIPLVEKSPPPLPTRAGKPLRQTGTSEQPPPSSRRSMGRAPILVSEEPTNEISNWCPVAMLCRRTVDPICGFDDNFGYGKFDDLCHMLQVNCYWKFNFAVVPFCRPVFAQ